MPAPAFFVPAAENEEQAEEVWAGVRRFLDEGGYPTTDRRLFRLEFTHKGKSVVAEVGQPEPELGEPVVIILEAKGAGLYYVCTPNRGVLRDVPLHVGAATTSVAIDFAEA